MRLRVGEIDDVLQDLFNYQNKEAKLLAYQLNILNNSMLGNSEFQSNKLI